MVKKSESTEINSLKQRSVDIGFGVRVFECVCCLFLCDFLFT